jgi:hypothetical protein
MERLNQTVLGADCALIIRFFQQEILKERNARSRGCLWETMLTASTETTAAAAAALVSAEEKAASNVKSLSNVQQSTCWAKLRALRASVGVFWPRCKQPDCQGATHVLHLALNGEKISCLQSARTTSFENMLLCRSLGTYAYLARCKPRPRSLLTYESD